MKDFLEKIKDILYDGMDYIIMIGIIAAIALIINWKLDGIFAISDVNELYDQSSELTQEKSQDVTEGTSTEKDEEKSAEKEEIADETNIDKSNEVNETITINIPAGSLPNDIGNILASEGLIESKDDFLERVIEENLETKLKYGEYEISKDSSIEEILKILTK